MKLFKLLFVIFLLPAMAQAASENFTAGKDYQVVSNKTQAAKNQVTEFFSYGCHYCYQLEPSLESWLTKQGNKIEFKRVPVVFQSGWDNYAKAYFIAKALGVDKTLTPALFKAIQQDKLKLSTPQDMINFFIKNDVDKAQVTSAFSPSPTMDILLKNGIMQMQDYKITGVPSIIVGGKYKVDLQMAGSPEKLFATIDYLLSK